MSPRASSTSAAPVAPKVQDMLPLARSSARTCSIERAAPSRSPDPSSASAMTLRSCTQSSKAPSDSIVGSARRAHSSASVASPA